MLWWQTWDKTHNALRHVLLFTWTWPIFWIWMTSKMKARNGRAQKLWFLLLSEFLLLILNGAQNACSTIEGHRRPGCNENQWSGPDRACRNLPSAAKTSKYGQNNRLGIVICREVLIAQIIHNLLFISMFVPLWSLWIASQATICFQFLKCCKKSYLNKCI